MFVINIKELMILIGKYCMEYLRILMWVVVFVEFCGRMKEWEILELGGLRK